MKLNQPVVLAFTLILLLALLPQSIHGADGSGRSLVEINDSLSVIMEKVEAWVKECKLKGIDAPPNLSLGFQRLERAVDIHIKKYAPTTAPADNPLKLVSADHKKAVAKDERRMVRAQRNIITMRDLYEHTHEKYKWKHQKTAKILAAKAIIDWMSLITLFQNKLWPITVEFFNEVIYDDITSPMRWVRRGHLLMGSKSLEQVSRSLQAADYALKVHLELTPATADEAIYRTGRVRYMSKDCLDLANKAIKEMGPNQEAVRLSNRNIADYIEEISKKVDKILARRANVRQCEMKPAPVEFAKVGESRHVLVTKLYDTDLRQVADASQVDYTYNLPHIVEFGRDGYSIVAKAVKEGQSEVKVTVTENGFKGVCFVTVKVGGAGFQLKVKPGKLDMVVGDTPPALELFTIDQNKKEQLVPSGVKWDSKDDNVATITKNGSVTAVAVGKTTVTAEYKGQKVSVPVTVKKPAGPPPTHYQPVIDISITAVSNEFMIDRPITFTRKVSGTNVQNRYKFSWLLDGEDVTAGKSFKRSFSKPGRHYVQLAMESSDPKENDAVIKNFTIDYPPEIEIRIVFAPETNVYTVGQNVYFFAKVKNAVGIEEYRWYIDGEYVGSGRSTVSKKFDKDGSYEIKLGLRLGSNFDEATATRQLTVGEKRVGILGTWINRFEATGGPEDLDIKSSYWRGGWGDWSEPISFNGGHIGAVDHYLFYTGEQEDTYNTGFLVYSPKDSGRLETKAFHFRWPSNPKIGPAPHGIVAYERRIDPRGKTIIPDTARLTTKKSRYCTIEWRTKDGSSCSARFDKFAQNDTFRYSDVESLGCEEGVYEPIEDVVDTDPEDDTDTDADDDKDDDITEDDVETSQLADLLVSGSYRVDAWVSNHHPSTWTLNVSNGRISGMSKWACCPGPRNDPLKGRIEGDTVVINRDCTGQGYSGACSQDYTGKLNGNVIEGSFDMNGRGMGTWKLYLDSKDDPLLTDEDDDTGGTDGGGTSDIDDDTSNDDVDDDSDDIDDDLDDDDLDGDGDDSDGSDDTGDNDDVDGGGGAGGTDADDDIDGDEDPGDPDDSDGTTGGGVADGTDVGGGQDEVGESSGISGLYTDKNGHNLHITQDGEKITAVALENKGPVGWKKVNGSAKGGDVSILFIARVEFAKLSTDGKQIRWNNGSVWSCFNASPTAQDVYDASFHPFNLTGLWVSEAGHKINASQTGDKVTVTALENNGSVGWKTERGSVNYWTVSILFFGSRVYFGKISDDGSRIDWGNGSVWTRQKPLSSSAGHGPSGTFIPYDQQGTNKLKIIGLGTRKQ